MPSESRRVLKWVAIGTLAVGLVGGIVQGLILAYWSGAKIENKADRDDVPTLQQFRQLEAEYHQHCVEAAQAQGAITTQLQTQGHQLDRIEDRVNLLVNGRGDDP